MAVKAALERASKFCLKVSREFTLFRSRFIVFEPLDWVELFDVSAIILDLIAFVLFSLSLESFGGCGVLRLEGRDFAVFDFIVCCYGLRVGV